jgi:ADP-ribose diphosphatase
MDKKTGKKPGVATLPKILDSRWRAPGEAFKIQELELEFSNGERRTYQRMNPRGLGAVIIVPMKDKDTVLLAREYAAGLHQYEIGLPKGRLEKGESVLEAAQREMKEEIGFGANRLETLTTLSLAPSYMTHITHIVLARDLYPEKLEGDEPEELEVIPWPIADLTTLTAREDCTEGRTIAALYIARDFMDTENS